MFLFPVLGLIPLNISPPPMHLSPYLILPAPLSPVHHTSSGLAVRNPRFKVVTFGGVLRLPLNFRRRRHILSYKLPNCLKYRLIWLAAAAIPELPPTLTRPRDLSARDSAAFCICEIETKIPGDPPPMCIRGSAFLRGRSNFAKNSSIA